MLRTLDVRRRVRRTVAVICALVAVATAPLVVALARADAALPRAAMSHAAARVVLVGRAVETYAPLPRTPEVLHTGTGEAVHAYPPLAPVAEPAPLVVMLHGMCCDPKDTCDWWSDAGREGSFLVCPAGNSTCYGQPDWHGTGEQKASFIDEGLAAVRKAYRGHVAESGSDVLVGFSRGAFVARDVIYARPGRFRAAILIGAALDPDPARFRASGIKKVVMASGHHDGARIAMQRSAARLAAAGLPARFVDLGPIGHALPDDLERVMREALAWVRSEP